MLFIFCTKVCLGAQFSKYVIMNWISDKYWTFFSTYCDCFYWKYYWESPQNISLLKHQDMDGKWYGLIGLNFVNFIYVTNTSLLWFHTAEVLSSYQTFTWLDTFPISCYDFLKCNGAIHIIHNTISHYCGIGNIYSTILTRLYQWLNILTYSLK